MAIISGLITDREEADVARVKELKKKILTEGLSSLSGDERTEYFGGMRGAYNYTDLNRVGLACELLYGAYQEAGISVEGYETPKTDWTFEDIPSSQQMNAYLGNIRAFKDTIASERTIPASMNYLNYEGANAIEQLLEEAEECMDCIVNAWMYSGETSAGEL